MFLFDMMIIAGGILPIYQSASSMRHKIEIKSSELETLTNKVFILSKLDLNVLKERVATLNSALPPRKDILLYLTSISGLSQELGLTFGGLSFSPGDLTVASQSGQKIANTTLGLESLETEIKMQGNQENVYTFLRTIEGVLPLMQIKDINVVILGDDQFSLTLKLGMLWALPTAPDVKGTITLFGVEEDKYFSQLAEYRKYYVPNNDPLLPQTNENLFAPFKITPQQ